MPTVAESGIPGYEVSQWNGLLAPARVPPAIITRLNNEIERVIQLAEMKTRLAADSADPVGCAPQTFGAFMLADIDKWSKVIKTAHIRAD